MLKFSLILLTLEGHKAEAKVVTPLITAKEILGKCVAIVGRLDTPLRLGAKYVVFHQISRRARLI